MWVTGMMPRERIVIPLKGFALRAVTGNVRVVLHPLCVKAHVGDGAGEVMVAHHAPHLQVFDAYDVEAAREIRRELVQGVEPDVCDPGMKPRQPERCRAAPDERRTIAYGRVSSHDQKDDRTTAWACTTATGRSRVSSAPARGRRPTV